MDSSSEFIPLMERIVFNKSVLVCGTFKVRFSINIVLRSEQYSINGGLNNFFVCFQNKNNYYYYYYFVIENQLGSLSFEQGARCESCRSISCIIKFLDAYSAACFNYFNLKNKNRIRGI